MSSFTMHRSLAAAALTMLLAACAGGSVQPITQTPTAPLTAVSGQAAGSISLSQTTYTVAQSAGTLTVTANRTGGSSGALVVGYATSDGTATAGSDYTAASGSLTWQDGDAEPKTFSVTLNSAAPFSGTRSFALLLSDSTGAAFLGSPSSATATIDGDAAAGSRGALAWSATTYNVAQSAGSLTVTVDRSGSTSGDVSVNYATADGTAKAGTDYTASSGTLSWAAGDTTAKTFTVAVSNSTPLSGTRSFTLTLSAASGGAALGSPSVATATISGAAAATAATVAWSGASYSVAQSAKTVTITAARSGANSGVVSVNYATTDGTAKAGTDYTASSGTLSWASGDSATKTFTVAVSNATPFSGTRNFSVALSGVSGAAVLGSPASAMTTINGSLASACAQGAGSYTTTGGFNFMTYGKYTVQNDNWGGTPGQAFWANSAACWGVTTTSTSERYGVGSYPHVTRGWENNQTTMNQLSTPGTNDWTTQSGMGISVTALTKARVHWAFNAAALPNRWEGLMDIYFHKTPTPAASMFYPQLDLMVDQAGNDQISPPYYGALLISNHASQVTIGGNTYMTYVDNPGQVFNQTGGHTIEMFMVPTISTAMWGSADAVTDVAAIIQFWMQSNPLDDAGKPMVNAAGVTITTAMITPDLYLNAINAGFEIDTGTAFATTAFCVAMQNEPDCQ